MDGVSVLDMSNKKVSVLDSGVFPILKIENFLPEDEYEEVKKEVKSKIKELDTMIKGGWKPKFDEGRNFYRLYLDNIYKEDRSKSKILLAIEKNLFSKDMMEVFSSMPETAFRMIPFTTTYQTDLTVYTNDDGYSWHNDVGLSRIANYVLMIDLGMKFEGGHTQISNSKYEWLKENNIDVDIDIKPKGNQLIVMPMWVTHRVSPIKTKTENLENSRITINGHIGFNVGDNPTPYQNKFT